MINELDMRIKEIFDIPPLPENEQKLRDELQLLYLIADNIKADRTEISDSVRGFAKSVLIRLENAKLMQTDSFEKSKCDLNALLLQTFKKLDKEGKRISFCAKNGKIYVLANEKAIEILFERLLYFCKKRMSVEVRENRIKIKSDCSFSELDELKNGKSDFIDVINKILNFHSSTVFFSTDGDECEISLSLKGMFCGKSDHYR